MTISGLVRELREQSLDDGKAGGLPDDSISLSAGGRGATAYSEAVATYLSMCVSRQANRTSSLSFWDNGAGNIQQVFGRQALAMTWDFAESNPFSDSSGGLTGQFNYLCKVISASPRASVAAVIDQRDAATNSFPERPCVIATDPPYYDNIAYADLSDFFYVWLRRSASACWPDLFRRLLSPKEQELVATRYRHGTKEAADRFFMEGMAKALRAMQAAAIEDLPLTVWYAFRQSEAAEDGLLSAGWAAFLQAMLDAGLTIDGTWPLRSELTGNLKLRINALSSAIVLVCRPRRESASVATRPEFLRALRRELPAALEKIREAGIQAVDFQQAAIGPGMGVFSRYAKIMEADDSAMPVGTALALINSLIEELASEQDATYDADTQAALVWFQNYGWTEQPSGQAITLATSKNTALDALFRSGVFTDLRGKVRLTRRPELPAERNLATDWRPTPLWEVAQHLARALDAEDGGIDAAACVFAGLGARAADVLPLVHRLYQIAREQRKDAAEALVWNRLATEWPTIERRAAELGEVPAPAEPTLFDRGAAQ